MKTIHPVKSSSEALKVHTKFTVCGLRAAGCSETLSDFVDKSRCCNKIAN
jgi:hypothetical protein